MSPYLSVEFAKLITVPFRVASPMQPMKGFVDPTVPSFGMTLFGKPPMYKSPYSMCNGGGLSVLTIQNIHAVVHTTKCA